MTPDPDKVREIIGDIQKNIDNYWSESVPFDNEKAHWNRQQVLVDAARAWLSAQDSGMVAIEALDRLHTQVMSRMHPQSDVFDAMCRDFNTIRAMIACAVKDDGGGDDAG